MFVDQASCHTSSDAVSCIAFKAGVLMFILIQLHIPSVVFITFAPITIAFVHDLYTFTVGFK